MRFDSIMSNMMMVKRYLIYGVFILALTIFVYHWHIFWLSRYRMEAFDPAMRFLSRAYIVAGLAPYQDFGIQYPPGVFLLAHIIPFQTLEQQNLVMYSFFLLIIGGAAIVMHRFHASFHRYLIALSAFMLLLVPLLHNENIADPLLGLLMMTVFFALRFGLRGKRILAALFLLPLIIVLWRWDRIVIFLCIESLLFAPYIVWRTPYIFRILLTQAIGMAMGLMVLVFYLALHGGIDNGVDFLYRLPIPVTMSYRDLPLPPFFSFPGILFLFSWGALALFTLYVFSERFTQRPSIGSSSFLTSAFLLVTPYTGLLYALGRSDEAHIYPMLFFTGISIALSVLLPKQKHLYLFILLLVIVIGPPLRFLPAYAYRPDDVFSLTKQLHESLGDCPGKTSGLSYASLFVGRTVYEQYVANNVALYFTNPSVPPATRYITDDPGIHNSCDWGGRVAEDLSRAPKPMLAFITDQPSRWVEENRTQEIRSCGKIEAFLTIHPYSVIGRCASYNVPYEIRIYE